MIEFIKPYLDSKEQEILQSQKTSSTYNKAESIEIIQNHFGPHCIPTTSGADAIKAIAQYTGEKINNPTVAIPDASCGTVYGAVKETGPIHLMDTDSNWNCVYDNQALKSDILLFADLSGKRMHLPPKTASNQVLIEDACQCYDGVSGFRETDYSVFSFSKGKQMYAGGGGMVFSQNNLSNLKNWMTANNFKDPMDWQIELMASQLLKINEINSKRTHNGLYLIDKLKDVDWIMLPKSNDHVFLKFIIFIEQSKYEKQTITQIPGRSRQMLKFMRHMASQGIQVEETYIPIHVRFPENFPEQEYKQYKCDHTWIEVITLPCRPDLTDKDLDQIVDGIKSFDNKRSAKQVFSDNYDTEAFRPAKDSYFKELFDLKFQQILDFTKKGDKILDIGCGSGDILELFYERGIASGIDDYVEVDGIDFVQAFLDEIKGRLSKHPFYDKQPLNLYQSDVTKMDVIKDEQYDVVFSLATLYYINDVGSVLKEMNRILKPNGYAILELGNENSLNNYESKRVSTNVEVFHRSMKVTEDLIQQAGLVPIIRRCFQVLPLYGGFHNNTAQYLVPILKEIMKIKNKDGIMLDELVSSAPFINDYSFRQLYVLKKDLTAERYNIGPSSMQYLVDDKAIKFAESIFHKFQNRTLEKQDVENIVKILLNEPNNALLIYTLMALHIGEKENALSNKFIKEAKVQIKVTQ